jgi:hypothetical protein
MTAKLVLFAVVLVTSFTVGLGLGALTHGDDPSDAPVPAHGEHEG